MKIENPEELFFQYLDDMQPDEFLEWLFGNIKNSEIFEDKGMASKYNDYDSMNFRQQQSCIDEFMEKELFPQCRMCDTYFTEPEDLNDAGYCHICQLPDETTMDKVAQDIREEHK